MKSTSSIYDQDSRVHRLLCEVTMASIKRVNPETGGSMHLAHNWGNEEAQKLLEQHRNREHFLFNLFKKHYHVAFCREYPDHMLAKRKVA